MTFERLFSLLAVGAISVSWAVPRVFAQTVPTFPSCLNPQGTLKVSYSEGTHGIAGSTSIYTGSDTVYRLSDETLIQCFCADDGNGIQTDWWKASTLSENEVQVLKNQGWVYVPNGALWGLTADPYLTKNSDYSCGSGGPSFAEASTYAEASADKSAGEGGIGGGGNVLGGELDLGSILGLATTGSTGKLYFLGIIAVTSFLLSYALRLNKSR